MGPKKLKIVNLNIRTPDLRQTLLINRAKEPYQRYWGMPHSRIDVRELPEEAAVRALRETIGIETEITAPAGFCSESIYENSREIWDFDIYYFNFTAEEDILLPKNKEGGFRWFWDSLLRGKNIVPSDSAMMGVLNGDYKKRRIAVNKEENRYELSVFAKLESWKNGY